MSVTGTMNYVVPRATVVIGGQPGVGAVGTCTDPFDFFDFFFCDFFGFLSPMGTTS